MTTEIDSLPVEDWDTDTLIAFLREKDPKFDDDDFEILRKEKITGLDFTDMTKEEFERCGLKIGPSRRLVEIAEAVKNKSKYSFTSLSSLKEVLTDYNTRDINQFLPGILTPTLFYFCTTYELTFSSLLKQIIHS